MAEDFSAAVNAWVRKSKKRMLVVFQQSAQDVVTEMQRPVGAGGNMPVDTGFLRSSLQAQINSAPTGYRAKAKFEKGAYAAEVTSATAQYTLTINQAKLGDSIYAVYLAEYAYWQEYGSRGRTGRGFVRLAAQKWPSIVAANTRKAQAIS